MAIKRRSGRRLFDLTLFVPGQFNVTVGDDGSIYGFLDSTGSVAEDRDENLINGFRLDGVYNLQDSSFFVSFEHTAGTPTQEGVFSSVEVEYDSGATETFLATNAVFDQNGGTNPTTASWLWTASNPWDAADVGQVRQVTFTEAA